MEAIKESERNKEERQKKKERKEKSARIRVIRGEEVEIPWGQSMKAVLSKPLATSLALLACISLLVATAFAAEGKPVTYKSGDETVNAILYTPAGKGPFPALIVIHEWWGLNDWVKDQAGNSLIRDTSRWPSISIAARSPTIPIWRTNSCADYPRIGRRAI